MHAITLAALAAFPDQLEAHFAAFPPEFIQWARRPGTACPARR
jgi:hypothetical protein